MLGLLCHLDGNKDAVYHYHVAGIADMIERVAVDQTDIALPAWMDDVQDVEDDDIIIDSSSDEDLPRRSSRLFKSAMQID